MEKILLVPIRSKAPCPPARLCQVMAGQLRRFFPQAQVKSIPVADGGEGSVEAFLAAAGGSAAHAPSPGPLGSRWRPSTAFWATAAPLSLRWPPALACPWRGPPQPEAGHHLRAWGAAPGRQGGRLYQGDFGPGRQLHQRWGAGAAGAAFGGEVHPADGTAFVPTGGTLGEIAALDVSPVAQALQGMDSPPCATLTTPSMGGGGRRGVRSPKGRGRAMVARLDAGCAIWGRCPPRCLGRTFSHLPGGRGRRGPGLRHGGLLRGPAAHGASTRCWTPWALTAFSQGRMWCSPARGKSTPKAPGARWSPGWRPGAGRQGCPSSPWWARLARALRRCTQQGLTAVFSIKPGRPALCGIPLPRRGKPALTMENIALAAGGGPLIFPRRSH